MFLAALVVAIVAWGSMVYHMIRMAMCRKPDAQFRAFVAMNPFNVMFFPGDLTDQGRSHRRRFLQSIALFMACVAFGLAIGALAGVPGSQWSWPPPQ
jgi:hypothetical protein